jgi:hypothetical protein
MKLKTTIFINVLSQQPVGPEQLQHTIRTATAHHTNSYSTPYEQLQHTVRTATAHRTNSYSTPYEQLQHTIRTEIIYDNKQDTCETKTKTTEKKIEMPYVIKLEIISNLFVKMCLLKVSKLPQTGFVAVAHLAVG